LSSYDVIIIGAGHNGLVAAAYLAKAGRRVLALEASEQVGGAATTEELFPGFRFSTCAGGGGYLAPEITRELDLASHGLEIRPADPVVFSPQLDGSHLCLWRDTQRTAREIEKFSAADAAAYPAFVDLMNKLAGAVGGLMRITPPDLPELGRADLRSLLTLAGPMRKLGRKNLNDLLRILPMPVSDLLDEWFESEVLKGAIAANGVRDITWGPREAGTAYTLLYNWALSDASLLRSAGHVRGGMGALSEAICGAARSFGVDVRTGCRVERIATEKGRATGVVLQGGERLQAAVLVSNADPRTTFLELLEPRLLPASIVRAVKNIKFRGSAARLHLALRELPRFTAAEQADAAELLSGSIQIAPTMMYIQKAYDCTKYGEYSPNPYLDIQIPTLSDPDLAPEGRHTMSITAKYAPYELRNQEWDEQRDVFSDTVLATLAEYAPGIQDLVLHQKTLLPVDLESRFGLPEGNGNHGEMTLDQFLHMRPIPGYARYEMPVAGLYLCGAGAHPGGGVTGIPGRNAARTILKS
jgi:phytoene dehydrogenase-like protein